MRGTSKTASRKAILRSFSKFSTWVQGLGSSLTISHHDIKCEFFQGSRADSCKDLTWSSPGRRFFFSRPPSSARACANVAEGYTRQHNGSHHAVMVHFITVCSRVQIHFEPRSAWARTIIESRSSALGQVESTIRRVLATFGGAVNLENGFEQAWKTLQKLHCLHCNGHLQKVSRSRFLSRAEVFLPRVQTKASCM